MPTKAVDGVRSIAVVSVALLLLGAQLSAQSAGMGKTWSLGTLKGLHYSKADSSEPNNEVGYSEIMDVVTACKAYSRGRNLLPQYHEPALTRGPQGVSLFRRISPSVVLVMTGNLKNDQLTDVGIGTGAIVDSTGYVLTNWHVIAGYQVAVIFFKPASGTEPSDQNAFGARLIAQDPTEDLALLKIIKGPASLTPIKLGDISNVQVAEDIHIIGHPHGLFWSYSTGVVSQVRDNYKWTYSDGSKHSAKVLQMQTAINPGNSGGPVLDDNGNILGLVAMSEDGQNLNYAIAVDVIRAFIARAMSSSRGGAEKSPAPVPDHFEAKLETGQKVLKDVYKDLTVYYVREANGSAIGLIGELSDGTIVRAEKPNSFGGFGQWEATLPGGKKVTASATGVFPETIQSETH